MVLYDVPTHQPDHGVDRIDPVHLGMVHVAQDLHAVNILLRKPALYIACRSSGSHAATRSRSFRLHIGLGYVCPVKETYIMDMGLICLMCGYVVELSHGRDAAISS